jgi:hypothetical protein
MARRGRFTNPNAGGQNLSSLIISLLRERKSAEEQLLLQRFQRREVTAEEVQAFYDAWSASSGYSAGSLEYEQLNDRKKNVYDTGIKYRYDDLIAEFNSSGGKNYSELMDFLNGAAQTVNDRNTAQQYLDLRKNVTNNFINEASNQLEMGQMTIDDFRSQIDSGIESSFEQGSKEYNDAKYAAFVAEYNGEYTKYQNRIKAGKSGAYSGFMNFLNQMKSRMSSEGIGGELLTRIEADMITTRSSGAAAAGGQQLDRVLKSQGVLAELYAEALSTSGIMGAELTAEDIAAGKTYSIADIANNPGALETWITMIENGTAQIDPELAKKYGIDSPDEIRTLLDKEVRSIEVAGAAANRLNPTENNATWASLSKALARTIGSRTLVDDVSEGMNQYASDLQRAGASGDDIAIARATNEWQKFLAGQKSAYGELQGDPNRGLTGRQVLDEQLATYGVYGTAFRTALSNTEKGIAGTVLGAGDQTLEDFFQVPAGFSGDGVVTFGATYSNGSIPETLMNYNDLVSGRKVQVVTRNPQTGTVTKVTTDPIAVGPGGQLGNTQIASKDGGYLSVITYVDGPNGQRVPVIQSIKASGTIQTADGTATKTWGYQYQMESGKVIYVSTTGQSYDENPFDKPPRLLEGGVYFVEGGTSGDVQPLKSAPSIDINSALNGADPKSFSELYKVANDLNALVGENSEWLQTLGAVDRANIVSEIGQIETLAKDAQLKSTQILLRNATRQGADANYIRSLQAQIVELKTGGSQVTQFNLVRENSSRYEEIEPGLYRLRQPTGPEGSAGGYALGFGQDYNIDDQGRELPDVVDIRIAAPKPSTPMAAGQANPFTTALGGTAFLNQGAASDTLNIIGDFFNFFRNTPTTPTNLSSTSGTGISANPMNDKYGGVPSAPTPLAPTSITPATAMPFNAEDPEARRALIAQQSQTPAPIKPTRTGGR